MKKRVIVVPSDGIIIVEGIGYSFKYDCDQNIHAIQWHNGSGHIEYNDGTPNKTIESYEIEVLPFVNLWKSEDARFREEAKIAEEKYNSEEVRFERLRIRRDKKLAETDFYILNDYPISESDLEKIRNYRQELRDITNQPGAPWDGGEYDTPWPINPLTE